MEKKQIQETIQQSFYRECQAYDFYLKGIKLLKEQIKRIEEEQNRLVEREETIKQIAEMKNFLSSEEFEKIKTLIKLSDEESDRLKKAVTSFTEKNKHEEGTYIEKLEKQIQGLSRLRNNKRAILRQIKSNILQIISYVSENDMELIVSNEIAETAYKAFVYYYRETYHFEKERNIINTQKSNLPIEFLKAYLAQGEKEEKALAWFEEEARKINF